MRGTLLATVLAHFAGLASPLLVYAVEGARGSCGSLPPHPIRVLDPSRLDFNQLGFDVDAAPHCFDGIERDFQARLLNPAAVVKATSLGVIDRVHYLAYAGERRSDPDLQGASAVVAQALGSEPAWILFEVSIDHGFGAAGPAEFYASPAGPLLRLPVALAGTGGLREDFLFVLRHREWLEIDWAGWVKQLRPEEYGAPSGGAIWKGVWVDPSDFKARTSVWLPGDANCCPSGGELRVRLALRGRRLQIERAEYP
jgi:hypothetical protein